MCIQYLFFYLSIYLSIYLFIYLSIYLSIHPSILLKYKCIYNIVIPVVYNMCTQCILQGPWVKSLRDNCPESKSAEWQYNHSVYKLSWFLHGSGANNPGSTIQVSNKQYHCAHTRTTVRTYLRRVGNNNGITNSSKWRSTSRRYNNTRFD